MAPTPVGGKKTGDSAAPPSGGLLARGFLVSRFSRFMDRVVEEVRGDDRDEARRDDKNELSSLRPASAPRGERRELETKRAMRTLDAE